MYNVSVHLYMYIALYIFFNALPEMCNVHSDTVAVGTNNAEFLDLWGENCSS